jgi:hypothetical protein
MEVSSQLQSPAALHPRKEPPLPMGQECLEPVWTLWRREKSVASARNGTSALQPIAIRTKLIVTMILCFFGSYLASLSLS